MLRETPESSIRGGRWEPSSYELLKETGIEGFYILPTKIRYHATHFDSWTAFSRRKYTIRENDVVYNRTEYEVRRVDQPNSPTIFNLLAATQDVLIGNSPKIGREVNDEGKSSVILMFKPRTSKEKFKFN